MIEETKKYRLVIEIIVREEHAETVVLSASGKFEDLDAMAEMMHESPRPDWVKMIPVKYVEMLDSDDLTDIKVVVEEIDEDSEPICNASEYYINIRI